jgi:hypothetical protein
VLVQETSGGSETLQIALWSATGGMLSIGTSQQVATSAAQPVEDTFSGTAGQYLGLSVSAVGGSMSGASITVLNPDGSKLTQGALADTCSSTCTGLAVLSLGPLPSTGIYTVLLQETSGGSETLQIAVLNPTRGTLGIDSSQQVSIGSGNPIEETFSGSAGQYLGLNVYIVGGAIGNASIVVLNPDGTVLSTGAVTSSQVVADMNFGPLASTGTYTVLITSGFSATLQIELWGPTGGTLTIGTQQSAPVNNAQPVVDTFSGASGQSLTVQVRRAGGNLGAGLVTVLRPDGRQLAQGALTSSEYTLSLSLGALPSAGTYTVLVQETSGFGGTWQIEVY